MDTSHLNELIEASKRNDNKAFREIVENFQSMIYSLSFRLLCDEEEAKDTVQETFIRVWMNLRGFDQDRNFSTWIYAIATNLCYDKLKTPKRYLKSESLDEKFNDLFSTENPEQEYINSDLIRIIVQITDKLTPKQKIVFTLRDLEALEIEEVSQITGLSANNIKSNLFLARQAIRNKLEKFK